MVSMLIPSEQRLAPPTVVPPAPVVQLVRPIDVTPAPPVPLLPTDVPIQPTVSIRAETLLKSASNLEKVGNIKGAIDFYRQVVIQYHKLEIADTARTRIKALGGTIPTANEYKPAICDRCGKEHALDGGKDRYGVAITRLPCERQEVAKRIQHSYVQPPLSPADDEIASFISGASGLHVGPRGGVYHYSANGNKVYQKK